MNSVVILQARTNSSRLPGKVLLPVQGIPLVVLAARRAANTGRRVVVATSEETSDDGLAEVLARHEIKCVRGSLNNTLSRFVQALEGYDDNTLVFRLTGDNVFPDGQLLDEMERDFLGRQLRYMICNGISSGLPYGMSVELTYASCLRQAHASTQAMFDQEHVMPYIRRTEGEAFFTKYANLAKGHLRCTVDCLDDYLVIQHVFAQVKDPVGANALDLVDLLASAPCQPQATCAADKMILGTVQLGMDYGITNTLGMPPHEVGTKIIKTAIANGIVGIDTARVYGSSEQLIGSVLGSGWLGRCRIITKLAPLDDCPSDAGSATVKAFVDSSIYQSCSALQTQTLDCVLLHQAGQLMSHAGLVWKTLLAYQSSGRIGSLGVSVQSPEELEMALETPGVDVIQMPVNILDWRWESFVPEIQQRRKQRSLVIHARSALLQGLLVSTESRLWNRANVDEPEPVIDWIRKCCRDRNIRTRAELCLRFVKSMDWVDGVVVGVETMEQLMDNIGVMTRPDCSAEELEAILRSRPELTTSTLNPALWRQLS